MLPVEYWIIVLVTAIAIIACVALHYEGLRLLEKMRVSALNHRQRIIFMILCLMLLHVTEVWIFGIAYYFLLLDGDFGGFVGMANVGLFDSVYFSATVFTTLGFGDIVPVGAIRFITGTESVAGLTLITWSASFTFVEMTRTRGSQT